MPLLARLDHQYVWHPFTQMRDWLKREPIVIVRGRGSVLQDARGRSYLDANSSIWTNLHGHNHPHLNGALLRQLRKIAHTSALGLANEPAALLAQKLVQSANIEAPRAFARRSSRQSLSGRVGSLIRGRPAPSAEASSPLAKVFFSDDGATAMEVALKLAFEFSRRAGHCRRPRFLSLSGAYHGDTVGASSLGHIPLFHRNFGGLMFRTDSVMSPYCYRCPFNRAKPERADARLYRKCRWECLGEIEKKLRARRRSGEPYAAMVVEPVVQGAAGMIPQPRGWLPQAAELVRAHGAQLIADEVLTGFGRTGCRPFPETAAAAAEDGIENPAWFAIQQEGVRADFMALAKGLTGGYLPMAATLTTEEVFGAFLGEYREFKTFFHGHSYTANPLGAATALASLELLDSQRSVRARLRLEEALRSGLSRLWTHPNVGDIRQTGLIAGIELVRSWRTRRPFNLRDRAGIRVCEAMARLGVLTRPIGNVIALIPPYSTTVEQIELIIDTTARAIREIFE